MLYDDLKWRGLVESITHEDLIEKLNQGGMTFYIGTDPTGDSLHIGHLSSMLVAKRLKDAGHNPIILVGGGTGLIGDPRSTSERDVISKEVLQNNYESLCVQIKKLFGFQMVNNYDWYKDVNFIDYLRDYGKCFNINYMLSKETVKSRLEAGISYTEFSYMILQSIDFLHLYEEKGVTLQIGGSDQWGNITSGLELIRKKHPESECFGFTMPLITKADGTKFGKSEGGAIWLDKSKTSSYALYQFLINSEDAKVIDYIKKLTFLTREKIEELEKKHMESPEQRLAQETLAKEVITFLHGSESYEEALAISEALFKGNVKSLSKEEIDGVVSILDHGVVKVEDELVDVLVNNEVAKSKREAREFITNGTISLNGDRVSDVSYKIKTKDLLYEKYLFVRRGKKKYTLLTCN